MPYYASQLKKKYIYIKHFLNNTSYIHAASESIPILCISVWCNLLSTAVAIMAL